MLLDRFLLELNGAGPLEAKELDLALHLLEKDHRQAIPLLQLHVADYISVSEVEEVLEQTQNLLGFTHVKGDNPHFLLTFATMSDALAFKCATLWLQQRRNIDVMAGFPIVIEDSGTHVRRQKLTARFDIIAEALPGFEIAKRIIGPCGRNMKAIICDVEIGETANSLKLRLRGQGSSYLEGPYNTESDEPLHLCVSCIYPTVFHSACDAVEALLLSIGRQYNIYRKSINLPSQKFFERRLN